MSGYTCDYVDADGGAYPAVRKALNALGAALTVFDRAQLLDLSILNSELSFRNAENVLRRL